jgi:hypothetical protein
MWRERAAPWTGAAAVVAGLAAFVAYLAIAGGPPSSAAAEVEHALVEHVDGSDVGRVTLSTGAIKRLDLRTVPAQNVLVNGKQRTVVPYGAILYDASGQTWMYANPKPRTFVRQRIAVDSIDGVRAILSARAAPGTRVVTVGVQELWGAELGIDDVGH